MKSIFKTTEETPVTSTLVTILMLVTGLGDLFFSFSDGLGLGEKTLTIIGLSISAVTFILNLLINNNKIQPLNKYLGLIVLVLFSCSTDTIDNNLFEKKGKGKGKATLFLRTVPCEDATPIPAFNQDKLADWLNNGYTSENTGGIGTYQINVYAYYGVVRFGGLPHGVYFDSDYNYNDVVYEVEIRDSLGNVLDSGCIDNGGFNYVSDFETSVNLTSGLEVHIVNIPNVVPRVL